MRDFEADIIAHLTHWKQEITKFELVYEVGDMRVYDTGPNWVIWGGFAQAHFSKRWEEESAKDHPEHERVLWRYLGRLEAIRMGASVERT